MRIHHPFIFCVLLFIGFGACQTKVEHQPMSLINTAHLDHLYDEMVVGGDSVGVIHIYSEYPDYTFVDDADEGFSCVDDVARAAIFYARQFKQKGNLEHERKMKMLTRYIFALQAPNGYFYNFIWPDGTINKEGITSKPIPDWWSWRALWALGEVYHVLSPRQNEPILAEINLHRSKLITALLREPGFYSDSTIVIEGITIPTWLPEGSASSEAAILLCGLTDYYTQQAETGAAQDSIAQLMKRLGAGITLMQANQPDSVFNGALLSWQNLWHAYGQAQSYALLKAGKVLEDGGMIQAAMREITLFYPAMIKSGGWDHFYLRKSGNALTRYDEKVFPQIAYGKRPAIWACLKAVELGGDSTILNTAVDLGNWFFGDNPASRAMYDPMTGRCFDGINSATDVNQNAGAESTIEALLAMQALEFAGVKYDPNQKRLMLPASN
jgi:hypothetical protein